MQLFVKYIKKYKLGKWIAVLIASLLLMTLSVVAVLYFYINIEVNLDSFLISYKKAEINHTSEFEEGSVVELDDLKIFFSHTIFNESFNDWLKRHKDENNINVNRNRIEIKKNISVNQLEQNSCKEIYCAQYLKPFEEIPPLIWKILIYIEDKRFLDHSGFDLYSIFRALINDLKKMRLEQGGSTLTQQIVKGTLLGNEKSFERKIKEIFYSYYLETKLSKDQILESYLNNVYWGSLQKIKIRGAGAAARFYFFKSMGELSPFESIILVSLLKGPHYFNPITNLNRLKKRAMSLYDVLVSEGVISSESIKPWEDSVWLKWQKDIIESGNEMRSFSVWASEKMTGEALGQYEKYILHRSIRPIQNYFIKNKTSDYAIKVYIRNFNQSEKPKDTSFYTKYERNLMSAIMEEKHQVGSVVKPILYEILLGKGLKWDDMIPTKPVTIKLKSGSWTPKDSHKMQISEVSAKEALERSINIPLVFLVNKYGFNEIEEEFIKYTNELKTPLREYPSQVLGSIELSLGQVSEMYFNFIKKDCELEKNGLQGVLGILSDQKNSTVRNVIDETLSKASIFGKTGTTNNGLDTWYVYFDGKKVGVIWVGIEGNRASKSTRLSGSTSSYKIFQNFINYRGKRIDDTFCP